MKITREQRVAIKRIYDRCDVAAGSFGDRRFVSLDLPEATYREFRKTVIPELCGDGAVMVRWAGMWLGIETDGHTHS